MSSHFDGDLLTVVCRLLGSFPSIKSISDEIEPSHLYLSLEKSKLGIEVHLIAKRRKNEPREEKIGDIFVHRIDIPYNLNLIKKLIEINKINGVDIVHAHSTQGIVYPSVRKLINNKPLVIHVHNTVEGARRVCGSIPYKYSIKYAIKNRLMNLNSYIRQHLMWKRADLLVAVSKSIAFELNEYYKIQEHKIKIVHNGVNTKVFKPIKNSNFIKERLGIEDKRMILYVGHLGIRKGLYYLIKASQNLKKEFPDSVILLIGGIPSWLRSTIYLKIIKDLIRKYNLQNFFILKGKIPNHILPYFYSASEAFILPSIYEGLPKVLLEAMACEKPVVATNVAGIPEIIENGKDGIIIPPKNHEEINKALIDILSDPQFSRRLGKNARKKIEEKFTWEIAAKKFFQLYQDLANQNLS